MGGLIAVRLVFMGSPDFAAKALTALLAAGHSIACVYSQPPRPAGRGRGERKTPVHVLAEARGLLVRTPRSLKRSEEQAAFGEFAADLAVVVAYGLILPTPILEAPRFGAINLHASLLPRWRGAAPIQRALMAGDCETGVEVMKMEAGLDTGPVLLSRRVEIRDEDTAGTLHERLAEAGARLLVQAVSLIEHGEARYEPQHESGVTYAHKITPAETRIDWARPAREVDCKIRGLSPFPGAWFELDGARVKALLSRVEDGNGAPGEILDDRLLVACGDGAVRLLRVQRQGKAAMPATDFLRGSPVKAGAKAS
jgi:methionyl-tRNA formyltransferase